MYAVMGLGNPGAKYADTRHNIGHMVVDALVARMGGTLSAHKQSNTHALSARIGVRPGEPGEQVIMAVSDSYMNTSGGPTTKLLNYFKVDPENLIVIHDELDLPFGTLRLKRGGGEGGHNGLKSISQSLGNKNYVRLRFGVGRPPGRQDPADFVLSPFSTTERKDLAVLIELAADAAEDVLTQGLEKAQLKLHTN